MRLSESIALVVMFFIGSVLFVCGLSEVDRLTTRVQQLEEFIHENDLPIPAESKWWTGDKAITEVTCS